MIRNVYNFVLFISSVYYTCSTRNDFTTKKSALVRKLAAFVGIKKEEGKEVEKPDDTYVLTNDNLIKIMGIQMRFRYSYISLLQHYSKSKPFADAEFLLC